MKYPFTQEQMALVSIARTSWRRRGSAKKHALSFDEEAVTQTVLMDLADNYPGNVTIVPFNKFQEGKIGADWAWAFQNADGTSVVPMLVQAKVLDLRDDKYPEINRFIGKSNKRQIDRLIDVADGLGWPAIYAFYNHLNDISRIPHSCGTLGMSGLGPMTDTWGISIADANCVRAVLNDQTFDTHKLHSKPLHCLLCSFGKGENPTSGSPSLVVESLRSLGSNTSEAGEISDDDRPPLDLPLSELPDLFVEAKKVANIQNGEERDLFSQRLAEQFPDIAGVVIVGDKEER